MQFALMENDGLSDGPCGVCGQPATPREFDVVVLSDRGPVPVCDPCCEQHATELLYMRSITATDLRSFSPAKPDKQHLLDNYARGTVQRFIDFKGEYVGRGDEYIVPDDDGDVVIWSLTWELSSINHPVPVQVLIHPEADCADVVRIVYKVADRVCRKFLAADERGNTVESREATTVGAAWDDAERQQRRESVRRMLEEHEQWKRGRRRRDDGSEFPELPF